MRRVNISALVVGAILILGLCLYIAPLMLPSIPEVKASSRTISLVGTTGAYYYWNNTNPTITVTQGDTLSIGVSSSNTVMHRLLIDLDKDGYTDIADCGSADVCSATVPPSNTISFFTVNSSPGTYTYYCTFHPTSMYGSFIVQSQSSSTSDFTVSPSTTSVTATQGSSATATMTLTSVNGFSGSVSLAASVSPSGPQPTFSPSSISLAAGGSVSSTLTISTASSGGYSPTSVPLGNYAVNVTASSGSLAHSTTVTLTVSSTSSSPSSSPSLPLLPIAGGVLGAIIVITVVALFLRRRRP